MRIIYHHRTLLDGAESIHIREMIRAFESLGHEVVDVSPAAGQPGGMSAAVRRVLPQAAFELAALAYNVRERHAAGRALRANAPAFVYKRHALNDLGILEAARRAAIPVVLEVNALYSSPSMGQFEPLSLPRLARTAERRALELATLVVTVSSPLKALVLEIAPRVRSVLVLPNGVDPDRFTPSIPGAPVRARHGIPDPALVVGWCGIMRSWHGLDLLLEAVGRTGCFLFLVGDGPERARVEGAAHELGMSGRVRFTGRVPERDVPNHIAAMDIGVVADDLTRYASPMKLIEYMAMGKPVVAPDLENIRDVIGHGREGLLFEPGSAGALAQRLRTLEDAGLRTRLGAAGRLRVETERNWTSNAQRVLDAIGLVGAASPRVSPLAPEHRIDTL